MPSPSSAYAASGVNIDAANEAVRLMKAAVQATYTPNVLAGIGSFGGLFDASPLKAMRSPVLVASTDGVGTKVKLAAQFGRFEGIGHDIVNHCVNDILVQGATPLFFLDYIASSRLDPRQVASVVGGMAAACRAAGCALLGGETAEMPGVYADGAFDVAGTIIGVVEREAMLPRVDEIKPGDVLIGLASSGPHTNGYSLIRKVFGDQESPLPVGGKGIGARTLPAAGHLSQTTVLDALLAPHRSYLSMIQHVRAAAPVKALAHITGGGFVENIPRVLPDGVRAEIDYNVWPMPPIFELIQELGHIGNDEMHRVFNCGLGMVIVAGPAHAAVIQQAIGEPSWVIGVIGNS
jgi:phosphoribosylformylglycinamidine cyclo-ligase/phosphoribosylamine--glycine ligase/phosphoribosylformylglycinamidine cyclo-ligase